MKILGTCAALAAVVLVACPIWAANQLVNPNFAIDLSGWTPEYWAISWTGSEGNLAPGALRAVATSAGGSIGAKAASQCTTAVDGVAYDFGGAFKIEPASTQTGGARLRVTWFSGPGCSGTPTIGGNSDPVTTAGWQALAVDNEVAPAGTQSAMVELIQAVDDTGDFIAYWDDIYFGPDPTPVELRSLSIE